MASIVGTPTHYNKTTSDGSTFTVTIPATTAGNTLVVCSGGGALTTCRITNGSGTTFTKRTTYGNGDLDVSVQDFTCVGGETTVHFTLNGAETTSGSIFEVNGLGAFIGWSGNGTGAATSVNTDDACSPTSSVNIASGNAVGFSMFCAVSATTDADAYWRQVGPYGRLFGLAKNQPGTGNKINWASAVVDVSSAKRYPANLGSAGDYRITSTFTASNTKAFTCQAFYANAGSSINAAVNDIVKENTLPGTRTQNWFLGPSDATNPNIAGYTDKPSYLPGQTVNFKVDSLEAAHRVEIYRLGHYGYDLFSARNVLGPATYLTGTPAAQSTPTVDGTLGGTSCSWTTTASWTIPADACQGIYHVIYRSTANTAHLASGMFVVTGSAADTAAFMIPDMTYNAYNLWGSTADNGAINDDWTGRNLYQAGVNGDTPNFAHRAYGVSMDRPWGVQSTQPHTFVFDAEMELLNFMEAQGYPISYHSCWDLDADTTRFNSAKVVVLPGHHEYVTTNVYDGLQNALNAGVNFCYESSNTFLWRVRFAAGDTNRRTMICYKDSGTRDVSAGFTGNGYDPVTPTGTWRDLSSTNGVPNPDRRSESDICGQWFHLNAPVELQHQVPFALKTKPMWRNSATVQALTTGQTFTAVKTGIGYEVDYVHPTNAPANLVKLTSRSPTLGNQAANANGSVYNVAAGTVELGFTMFRHSSGALVFNTGSWRGFWGINRFYGSNPASSGASVDLDLQNGVVALLYDLGLTPVHLRPPRPSSDEPLTDPATGAPGPTRNDVALAYGLTVPAAGNGAGFFSLIY